MCICGIRCTCIEQTAKFSYGGLDTSFVFKLIPSINECIAGFSSVFVFWLHRCVFLFRHCAGQSITTGKSAVKRLTPRRFIKFSGRFIDSKSLQNRTAWFRNQNNPVLPCFFKRLDILQLMFYRKHGVVIYVYLVIVPLWNLRAIG